MGDDGQVLAIERRLQETASGVPSRASALVDLKVARALVVAAIEILDARDPGLLGRVGPSVENVPLNARGFDTPFPAAQMNIVEVGRLKRMLVFVLHEVGQNIVPGPSRIAELAPEIIVAGLTAHVDHAVDRRTATEHLAAWIVETAPVEAGLLCRLEPPVDPRIAVAVEIADRDVDPHVIVLAAGFEQQHPDIGIGR